MYLYISIVYIISRATQVGDTYLADNLFKKLIFFKYMYVYLGVRIRFYIKSVSVGGPSFWAI